MGNVIQTNGNIVQSDLTDYITDFMIKKNDKNTLKIRACCTKQMTMPIGLELALLKRDNFLLLMNSI